MHTNEQHICKKKQKKKTIHTDEKENPHEYDKNINVQTKNKTTCRRTKNHLHTKKTQHVDRTSILMQSKLI